MGESDSQTRNNEAMAMLDYGFANYSTIDVLSKNQSIGNFKVYKGKINNINLYPLEDVTIVYEKMGTKPNITYDVILNDLKAPLKANQELGKLVVKDGESILREISIISKEEVKKANIFELYFKVLNEFL